MKKIFSVALALALFFSVVCNASATEIHSSADVDVITEKECYLAGEKWLKENYNDGTRIESVVPVKDLYDELNGYCINFSKNNEPNGYLLLNASKDSASYIREFSLTGKGIYDQLIENSGLSKNVASAIYTTNPFEYAVRYTDAKGEHIYNCDDTIMSLDTAKKQYSVNTITYVGKNENSRSDSDKETYYTAFFFGADFSIGYSDENDHVIPGADVFVPYTMGELRNGVNTKNCGPTAAANICALYYSKGKTNILISGDIDETYAALVSEVGFDPNSTTDETNVFSLRSGLRRYVRDRSYSISVNGYLLNWWSGFQEDFDDNMSNLIFIQGNKQQDGEWVVVGHFVVGIGYRILNDGSRYIRVYDGWNKSNTRFLHFDADSLVTFMGASVTIS